MRAHRGRRIATALLAAAIGSAAMAGGAAARTTTKAKGKPVKVVVILDESEAGGIRFDTARAGVKAKVKAINADGGLGGSGRPVQVEYCVTELDPNKDAECARKAADDPDVVAVVASVIGYGDTVNPILENAGLANVGGTAFSQSDGLSTISFPVMGGLVAAVGCQATLLADKAGAKNISVAYGDTPGAELGVVLAGQTLKSRDLAVKNQGVVPVGKADVSAEVTAIAEGSDGIVTASDGETAKKIIRTARQLGLDAALAGSGAQQFTPEAIKALGSAADGVYLALWFATDDTKAPGVKAYLAGMKKAGAKAKSDDLAKNSWLALSLLDRAAQGQATIDRASILSALQGISDFDTGGLTPTLDFTQPGSFLGGAQPRVVNDSCAYGKIKNGKIVTAGKGFVDPFQPPSS
jgi:branched-chain amino acid transport system substrate-binding protein